MLSNGAVTDPPPPSPSPVPRPFSGWPPDANVVAAAQQGEGGLLADLLAAGFPRLVGFFRGAGIPAAEAEDLASDVCESIVRSLGRLRRAQAFEAWFWTIARTRLKSWIRVNRRAARHPPAGVDPVPPDELVGLADEHRLVRAALEALTTRDRQLLWLREVEGLSYEEIGGRLRAATGTVRVACHRARQRLDEAYQRLTGSDDFSG